CRRPATARWRRIPASTHSSLPRSTLPTSFSWMPNCRESTASRRSGDCAQTSARQEHVSSLSPRRRWPATGSVSSRPGSTATSRSRSTFRSSSLPSSATAERTLNSSNGAAKILVVDDLPENVRLLEAVLAPRGYEVVSAHSGAEALELVEAEEPDLILLDVVMPGMDGYAVCEQLRENEETAVLPVIMVTSSIGPEKTKAIEAGADDFIPKPFNHDELLTRVRSLLRIKRYHDTIKALNRTLEERVETQVEELERVRQLGRFLSPQVAEAIVSSGDDSILRSHRREVAVFFADLRGWTSFVDGVEPEELLRVLREFHDTIGRLVQRFEATVGFLEGDGVQLF